MTVGPLNVALPQTSSQPIFTAPQGRGRVLLGRTLPSLLDEACTNNPNDRAFNEISTSGWRSLSTLQFRARAEALAVALLERGLEPGDRVALYTHSDLSFCLSDMACLIAGLVSVPIYLTYPTEMVHYILQESSATMLVVSDALLGEEVLPALGETSVETVLFHDGAEARTPEGIRCTTVPDLVRQGEAALQRDPKAARKLRQRVEATDLATIIYTSGTSGTPRGVMLSHENIASNALAAISGIPELRRGQEVVLSFLPMTHVFARTLHYAYLAWGAAVYFTTPERVRDHINEVRPTAFATVPRVLERVFEGILKAGTELSVVQRPIFDWAIALARRFEPEGAAEKHGKALYSTQRRAAHRLVFDKWRAALGGELRLVVSGGAALRPELVRVFGAAGVEVLQGYGLTETSPIIAYNRPGRNRPGTVGELLAGVEVKIGRNGEILTRGPQVMQGYYGDPEATNKAIDREGWLHTGDLGEMSPDGYLSVTGRIKNLFKLSTGKFVMPQPLELALEAHSQIEHALVVGEGQRFCAVLLFLKPGLEAASISSDLEAFVREANRALPHWSQAKRALLVSDALTIDNDFLTPTLKVKRDRVLQHYEAGLEALFATELRSVPSDSAPYIIEIDSDKKPLDKKTPDKKPPDKKTGGEKTSDEKETRGA